MFSILKKEINSFLSSFTGSIIIAVFWLVVGLFVWIFPDYSVLEANYADLGVFFNITPYILLFLVPAITMRSFADEFKSGTIELLFTKPISRRAIVLGKFWANWLLVAVCLLPTFIYYYSLYDLGSPQGNIDTAAVIGSFLGLLLLSGVFCAVGVWASSLSDNQVLAFVVGIFVCFLLYAGLGLLARIFNGNIEYFVSSLGLDSNYQSLGKGVLDSRNLLYLCSVTLIFLYLTEMRLTQKQFQ